MGLYVKGGDGVRLFQYLVEINSGIIYLASEQPRQ